MTDKLKEGTKLDKDKNRVDLVPPEFIEAVGWILEYGARKYEDNNWRKGIKYSRIVGALLRHLYARLRGEILDPESGMPHLWHAACNIAFLITYEWHSEIYKKFNDLYTYPQQIDKKETGQQDESTITTTSDGTKWYPLDSSGQQYGFRCSRTLPCEYHATSGCTYSGDCPYKTTTTFQFQTGTID